MTKWICIKVYGRVQGVFFRHSARLKAEELGLRGFARNENDGSVTLSAEGEEQALYKFLKWAGCGPPLARVDEIKIEWLEAGKIFKGFEVK